MNSNMNINKNACKIQQSILYPIFLPSEFVDTFVDMAFALFTDIFNIHKIFNFITHNFLIVNSTF